MLSRDPLCMIHVFMHVYVRIYACTQYTCTQVSYEEGMKVMHVIKGSRVYSGVESFQVINHTLTLIHARIILMRCTLCVHIHTYHNVLRVLISRQKTYMCICEYN